MIWSLLGRFYLSTLSFQVFPGSDSSRWSHWTLQLLWPSLSWSPYKASLCSLTPLLLGWNFSLGSSYFLLSVIYNRTHMGIDPSDTHGNRTVWSSSIILSEPDLSTNWGKVQSHKIKCLFSMIRFDYLTDYKKNISGCVSLSKYIILIPLGNISYLKEW